MNKWFKNEMPLDVWLLTIAQGVVGSVGSMVVFIGGFLGTSLAPQKNLATLPIACIVVGTALSTIPVSLLRKKIGRKKTFVSVLILSVFSALLAAYAVYIASFYLLCFAIFLLGITNAAVMQFRFAAMECIPVKLIPKAASTVLLGGLAAAYLGPEMGLLGKSLFGVPYVGSFVLLSGLFTVGLFVFIFYKEPISHYHESKEPQRPLKKITRQPVLWVAISSAAIGYAIMSFIMTATPISMHQMDGHSLSTTKMVIQSHIVAMYLPSLFSAWVIRKIGIANMLLVGLFIYAVCLGVAYFGQSVGNYWVALVLLGVGWNFLFIGGTSLLPTSYHSSERFKVQAMNDFLILGTQTIAVFSAGGILFSTGWRVLLLSVIPFILLQMIIVLRWKVNSMN